MRIKFKLFLTIVTLTLVLVATGCGAKTPPETPVYREDSLADYPILSVVEDNPRLGDEHDFLRIAPYTEGKGLMLEEDYAIGDVELVPGQYYAVLVYLRNAADPKYGEELSCESVVTILGAPETIKAGESADLTVVTSWGGKEEGPSIRGDDLSIKANTDIVLSWRDSVIQDEPIAVLCTYDDTDREPLTGRYLAATDFSEGGVAGRMFICPDIAPGYDEAIYLITLLKVDRVSD